MKINPLVIDVSHYETTCDFVQAYAFGIRGVIHKATESVTYRDADYAKRRIDAVKAGMLWGAYHFLRPGDMVAQAKFFYDFAKPDAGTMMFADHEDVHVSADDLFRFLVALGNLMGRTPSLYTGFLIKDQLQGKIDKRFAIYKLWHAQYANAYQINSTWKKPFLWQYTGDGSGPLPHNVPGIVLRGAKGIDISHYDGTPEQLRAEWLGVLTIPTPAPAPTPVPVPKPAPQLPPDVEPVPTPVPAPQQAPSLLDFIISFLKKLLTR